MQSVTKQEIQKYLTEVGTLLHKQDLHGEIVLAGGAAMMFLVGSREATKDVDAYLGPPVDQIRHAIREVAHRHSLPMSWLNDGVKGFFYGTPPQTVLLDVPGLTAYAVTPPYLLAMKVAAGRPEDVDDIRALIRALDISGPEALSDLVLQYLPPEVLTVRAKYLMDSMFE